LKSRFPKAMARVDTLGYLPRGYIGVIDETDRKEAFAAGAFAVQSALTGSGSVVLHYDGDRIEPRTQPRLQTAWHNDPAKVGFGPDTGEPSFFAAAPARQKSVG
jgi:6-phosphofructokinase